MPFSTPRPSAAATGAAPLGGLGQAGRDRDIEGGLEPVHRGEHLRRRADRSAGRVDQVAGSGKPSGLHQRLHDHPGAADALEARGLLGTRAKQAVQAGRLRVLSPYRIRSIARPVATLEMKTRMAPRASGFARMPQIPKSA